MCKLDTHGKDRSVTGRQAPHQILEMPLAVAHTCAQRNSTSPLLRVVSVRVATWVPLVTAKCICLLWLRHTGQISELCQCLHRPRLLSCWRLQVLSGEAGDDLAHVPVTR